jgi:hypothetical protein
MNLPFTTEQFLSVFGQYNQAVWPVQIVLSLLGLASILLAVRKIGLSDRLITMTLSFFWLWIGLAYHLAFFTAINPAAYAFAVLTAIQGIVFLIFGVFNPGLSFHFRPNVYGLIGALMILYAMIIYPVLGYKLGHIFPESPTFGLPCPTTIFTFGLLLWTQSKVPRSVLVIPFLWSLIGFSAALTLGILEDTGLLVAGIVGVVLIIVRDKNAPKPDIGVGQGA